MPSCYLDIKNIIFQISNFLQITQKLIFKLNDTIFIFITFNSSKNGHHLICSLACKLKLSLTDINEITASLNKCVIFCKNCFISIKSPFIFFGGVILDHLLAVLTYSSPFLAAIDAFIQICHALVNITIKHILFVNCSPTSSNDLIADLGKQTLHTIDSTVMFTEFPNYTNGAKNIRKNFRNITWTRLLNLLTRFI